MANIIEVNGSITIWDDAPYYWEDIDNLPNSEHFRQLQMLKYRDVVTLNGVKTPFDDTPFVKTMVELKGDGPEDGFTGRTVFVPPVYSFYCSPKDLALNSTLKLNFDILKYIKHVPYEILRGKKTLETITVLFPYNEYNESVLRLNLRVLPPEIGKHHDKWCDPTDLYGRIDAKIKR